MFTAIFRTVLLFTYINSPSVTLRKSSAEDAEVCTQAYYSEPVKILEERGSVARLQTSDGYSGWAPIESICRLDQPFLEHPKASCARINRPFAHIYAKKSIYHGALLTLPFESRLELIDQCGDPNGQWIQVRLVDGRNAYVQRGDVVINPQPMSKKDAVEFSKDFIGLPYTWGGRTGFGYDCSGFTQMVYRLMGILIPRDSKDQLVYEGFKEIPLDKLQAGDLVFFGIDSSQIRHVGLSLGGSQFIHASGQEHKYYLRISDLKDPDWNGTGEYKYQAARTLQ